MKASHLLALLGLSLSLTSTLGCATTESDAAADDPIGDDVANVTSQCTQASYDKALGMYRKAVETAKVNIRDGAYCNEEATPAMLAHQAGEAVATCATF